MSKIKITDLLLYRWRYVIGYAFVSVALLGVLYIILFVAPGGLSQTEMNSVVTSMHLPAIMQLATSPDSLIHLPYHLLQHLSVSILGVTTISVKLPSVIMAIGALAALYVLLRIWFRQNIALIATIIAVCTGPFLYYTQLGTPEISYLFWNAALLACASLMARTNKVHWLWLLGTAVLGALSLYSPYQLYMVVALLLTSLFHPHARYVVFRQPKTLLIFCVILFAVIVAPLVLAFITKPALIVTFLGLPTDLALLSWGYAKHVALQYGAFWRAENGVHMTPIYGLGVALLALLGLFRLFTAKYTAKSYIITIWAALLLPVLFFNISAVSLTFIPTMLLVAFAVDYLITYWYRLFPINPYARAAGLIPLTVLVLSLVVSGVERFVYGYHYDPKASQIFTHDLALLNAKLDTLEPDTSIQLLVDEKHAPFYQTYSDARGKAPRLTVVSSSKNIASTKAGVIITDESHKFKSKLPSEVLVDSTSVDANRFYLYKNK